MENVNVDIMLDELLAKAKIAAEAFGKLSQEEVDEIVKAMSLAAVDKHMYLARYALNETKRGVYEDKITKNLFASEYVYNNLKDIKTVNVIEENVEEGYDLIAEPVGIIAGVTPVTNPTSTTIFKSIISAKTRNVIVFAFHPSAQKCSSETLKVLKEAGIKAGAPEDFLLYIETPSIEATNKLLKHKDIDLILATGGSGMVKSAYSSGNPAIGVGPGNTPCYINKSANIKRAINDLIMSKSFDNGMICASEQSVIVDVEIKDDFEEYVKEIGCVILNDEEKELLKNYIFLADKNYALNTEIVGKSAFSIAQSAGISIPKTTKVILVGEDGVGESFPFSQEKLSPILAYYIVADGKSGVMLSSKLIDFGGAGHTAVVHSSENEVVELFSSTVKAGRILVNSPATHGAIGDIYNSNTPSLTLGCGTYGGNLTTSNVSCNNLINLKKVAKRKNNMQWFKVPEKIYFERGSISYLKDIENINRVFIVTDDNMIDLGFVDKVVYHLNKNQNKIVYKIFSDVESDPSFDTVLNGVASMNDFKPDAIIALGGGSPIDAAKGMWLFYENPDVNIEALKLKFLDIRKKVEKFPEMGTKVKFIAIPTTSGTGSEVTAFAVITDKINNKKYPLADYQLTPSVAIIDTDFVMSMPSIITADTGMDVLTHAIESYVSVMASDYTDPLAEKAVKLVFENLVKCYNNPSDLEAREKMHNASTLAGLSFTNSFLGITHSLSHKISSEFHIAHGRINAILLPYVIKYNSEMPTKLVSFPKYEYFIADEKYRKLAEIMNFPSNTKEEGVNSLIAEIKKLNNALSIESSFKEFGLDEGLFLSKLDLISENAFEDQCTTANPRLPLISELKELLISSYYGM